MNSLHPGAVLTEFGRFSRVVTVIMRIFASFLKVCSLKTKYCKVHFTRQIFFCLYSFQKILVSKRRRTNYNLFGGRRRCCKRDRTIFLRLQGLLSQNIRPSFIWLCRYLNVIEKLLPYFPSDC